MTLHAHPPADIYLTILMVALIAYTIYRCARSD